MKVTGPVTAGARGYPFSLPIADLDELGYIAEEFFVEGTATSYTTSEGTDLGVDGEWALRPHETAPFRTRMLVVRPTDPRANGVVHVNWQNVSLGFEVGTADNEQLLADGCVWVGISAQRVGIDGFPGATGGNALRAWDAERYGSLEHPGDDFSFDIFTQVARAIGPETLGGLTPRVMVATGGSQSAMRLSAYANGVQPLEKVFDAFWFHIDFGSGALPDTNDFDASKSAMGIRPSVPVRIRGDLGVPAIVFISETEAPTMNAVLQPDTERFRLWEVTGTSHTGGLDNQIVTGLLFARDGIGFDLGDATDPALASPNVVSFTPAFRAAWVHFHRWIDGGPPPPAQPRIEFDDTGTISRDLAGNAIGGIRLPDLAAPTGVHQGSNSGGAMSALIGSSRSFTHDELVERYGDRETYLAEWNAALDAVVASGAVLTDDAPALRATNEATAEKLFEAPPATS